MKLNGKGFYWSASSSPRLLNEPEVDTGSVPCITRSAAASALLRELQGVARDLKGQHESRAARERLQGGVASKAPRTTKEPTGKKCD